MPMDPAAAPQGSSASPPTPPPSAKPSVLAGGAADGDQAPAPPDSDEGLKQVVQQVRQMQVSMTELARQFPAAAQAFRQSMAGLRAAMRQIIANPSSPEPPSPNIGG